MSGGFRGEGTNVTLGFLAAPLLQSTRPKGESRLAWLVFGMLVGIVIGALIA